MAGDLWQLSDHRKKILAKTRTTAQDSMSEIQREITKTIQLDMPLVFVFHIAIGSLVSLLGHFALGKGLSKIGPLIVSPPSRGRSISGKLGPTFNDLRTILQSYGAYARQMRNDCVTSTAGSTVVVAGEVISHVSPTR